MRQIARVDSSGFFAEDVLLEDDAPLQPGMVPHGPPDGFYEPQWNPARSEWVEGESPARALERVRAAKFREVEDAALTEIEGLFSTSRPEYEALLYISIALTSTTNDDLTKEAKAKIQAIVEAGKKMRNLFAEVAAATDVQSLEALVWS